MPNASHMHMYASYSGKFSNNHSVVYFLIHFRFISHFISYSHYCGNISNFITFCNLHKMYMYKQNINTEIKQ